MVEFNYGLPAGFTACEEYSGWIIATKDGWYEAFPTDALQEQGWVRPMPVMATCTRRELRSWLDGIMDAVALL